jgi:hypothetical protein
MLQFGAQLTIVVYNHSYNLAYKLAYDPSIIVLYYW